MENKKYFAKYLPVEGKIKEGDKVLREYYGVTGGFRREVVDYKYTMKSLSEKKVKLFLCSRDIQVGDELYYPDGKGPEIADDSEKHQAWIKQYGLFKVIGEISKDATWVKEGDEFSREELLANGVGVNWNEGGNCIFKIKGPCGHFH